MVTGAKGMLGRDLCEALTPAHEVFAVDLEDFDITEEAGPRDALAQARPDLVIHCAAWTDVDGCERDPGRASLQNETGARNVATAAAAINAAMVYISTDFVFDGAKNEPYTEDDIPHPLSVYGASKLAGEEAVRRLIPRHFIVRSAWLYGRHGKNFVRTIIQKAKEQDTLKVVGDQRGSPTYTRDLAQALVELIVTGQLLPGTYHLVNSGDCSWAELAAEALRLAGRQTKVEPIPASAWPSPTRRPAYSVLRSRRLEEQNIPPLREWREALADYVKEAMQWRNKANINIP
jgi:dTDP-4-dehydrorhamnose reductase